MRSTLVFLAALVAIAGSGCRDRVTAERVPAISDADAMWAGGGFCARTRAGLACWGTAESTATGTAPTLVAGLTGVKDVALRTGEGCALHDKGVSCFRPGDASSRAMTFDGPTQVIATAGYAAIMCALHSGGVSCWGGEAREREPSLRAALGKPKRLLAGSGGLLCGVYEDGTRCFPVGPKGLSAQGVFLPTIKDPKNVTVSTIGGHVYVHEGEQLFYGEFAGTLQVGNPFAVAAPLDVGVTLRPFTGATVTLRPVPGIGVVRAMAMRSIWVLVLDDNGVAELDFHGGNFDIKRWPVEGVPSALYTGYHDDFFTVEGGKVHQRTWQKGDRIDREIAGLSKPARMLADVWWTCALDESGGVACIRSPKI